jgi:broad-specificity NMP kinase
VTPKPLSAEFFGMPGVGKSTLCKRVAEIICERGIPIEHRTYDLSHHRTRSERIGAKLPQVIKEVFTNPTYAIVSTRAIFSTKQKSAVDLARVLFNWLFISSSLQSEGSFFGIRLFDQGIFQALWSIGLRANRADSAALESLCNLMPMPTVAVVVEANLQALDHRLKSRERHDSRIERHLIDMPEITAKSAALFNEIKSLLMRSEAVRQDHLHIVTVDNNRAEDFEENAVTVANAIERVFKAQSSETLEVLTNLSVRR